MLKRPNIGILAQPSTSKKGSFYGESDSFYRDLTKQGSSVGINVFVFNEKDIDFNSKKINGNFAQSKKWIRKKVSFPKVVYDRAFRLSVGFRTKLEKHSIQIINPPELAELSVDKFKTYNLLFNNGFKLSTNPCQPETFLYSTLNLKNMVSKYNSVFLKPRFGSKGRGVMSVMKTDSNKYLIRPKKLLLTKNNLKNIENMISKRYIVEQGVELKKYKDSVFDIRVLVQRGKNAKIVLAESVARVAGKGRIVSNIHSGGHSIKLNNIINDLFGKNSFSLKFKKRIQDTSFKIFQIIEKEIGKQLCELAIDLMIDKKGKIYVIEINSKPGRIFKALSKDLINKSTLRPMEFAAYLASRK